jgi:hypothetical protein
MARIGSISNALVDNTYQMLVFQSCANSLLVPKLFIDGFFTGMSARLNLNINLESRW